MPPIVLSKLLIANEDVQPGQGSVLKQGLDDTRELVLSHREIFSQFSSLHLIILHLLKFSMLIFWKVLKKPGILLVSSVLPLIPTYRKDTIFLKFVRLMGMGCGQKIRAY